MRWSVVLLCCSLAGVVGGAFLIGRWAVGCAVIADSVALAVFVLRWDDGQPAPGPQVRELPTLAEVLERNRAS